MIKAVTVLLVVSALVSCSSGPSPEELRSFKLKCQSIQQLCNPRCMERRFRSCWVDSKLFPNEPTDIFQHCHATHVGSVCPPCEQKFSLNYGGVMREVACEDFLASIARKNKSCGNCLQKYGDAPLS